MATRFAVAAGNWSSTATWAATSGGAPGASAPVAGDDVTIDANTPAGTVVVDAASAAATVTINNAAVTLRCDAALTLTGAMTLTAGTLNTNGQAQTWGSFSSNNANNRTLTLGASAITITGTAWMATGSTTTNLVISANTAIVTFTSAAATTFFALGLNWNGLSIVASASFTIAAGLAGNTGTVANVTRQGAASKIEQLTLGGGLTITGTLTLGGGSTQGVNRLVVSNSVGAANITVGAVVITGDVDFLAVPLAYSGAASWTNAGNAFIGDAFSNSAVIVANRTAPVAQAATGTAGFTWSTHGWTTRVPLPQDDVTIANAFVAGQTITGDMPRIGRSIDFSGCTGNPTFNANVAIAVKWFADITFGVGMTLAGNAWQPACDPAGPVRYIRFNGCRIPQNFNLTGNWAFADTASIAGTLIIGTCTLDFNGQNATIAGINISSTAATVYLRSGTITVTGTAWSVTATPLLFDAGTSTILLTDVSATTKTFAGGGLSYYTLRRVVTGSSAGLVITGNNTFVNLDLETDTARTVTLPAGGTQTITGTLTLQGAAGQLLSLASSVGGTATTLAATTTTINAFVSRSADVRLNQTMGTADTATASDSVARQLASSRATSDTAPAVDAVVQSTVVARATSDTAAATDAVTRSHQAGRSVTDTITGNDSVARSVVCTRTPVDAVMAIDQIARNTTVGRAVSDTAAASDTPGATRTVLRGTADSATSSDTIVFTLHHADPAQLTVTIALEATIALSASSA